MTRLQLLSKISGKSLLTEELSNDFNILRNIKMPQISSAIEWLSQLSEDNQKELIRQVFDSSENKALAEIYFTLTSGEVGPRFIFRDRKKLLKYFLGSSTGLEFSPVNGETIMAFWDVGRFKVVTTIVASDKLYNIQCRHTVKSDDPQMSGPFSLLGAVGLYHGDCWKSDKLELEASIQGVSVVLREGCDRLRRLLKNPSSAVERGE